MIENTPCNETRKIRKDFQPFLQELIELFDTQVQHIRGKLNFETFSGSYCKLVQLWNFYMSPWLLL